MIQHKAGEYFGLVESRLAYIWEELPDTRPILVTSIDGMYGKQDTSVRYRKGYLKKPEAVSLQELQLIFSTIQKKEDDMSISGDLLEAVKQGGAEALETALQERLKVLIRRAYKKAEEECEFVAMAEIAKVQEKYGTPIKSGPVVELKDAKEIKLTKTDSVAGPVWDAILTKASKLGVIMSSAGNKATVRIKNADAKVFEKACGAVKGITLS